MRLWLSKNSEVPLREQLVTQIKLGVLSHDLRPGERLPSTRELARRYRIHANTVSAAYRQLEQGGWLEYRRGSGVYVRPLDRSLPLDAQLELDQLIAVFLQRARAGGFSLGEIQTRVRHWLALQPPDHFLVLEPDPELRAIVVAEIAEATGFAVRGAGLEEVARAGLPTGAAAVALYGQSERVRALLPPDTSCVFLRSRSIPDALAGQTRPEAGALVTVVSRWPEFLRWARAVLVSVGLDPAALNTCDARTRGWQRGVRASTLVISDALTARQLPAGCAARVFRVIADDSVAELRAFVANFLTR
ncbi:MAG TPA: GntR family transcriptional regulator [Pyrinomonadaceae bacterium]|jgi:GntR family transcriptional regulator